MEEEDPHTLSTEIGEEEKEEEIFTQNGKGNSVDDKHVLQFLDSTDEYLTQMDSLSTILRQGWLELASARLSMGVLRVNGAVLDLKSRSASTSLRVTEDHDDSDLKKAHFTLCKWASSEKAAGEGHFSGEKLSESPQLRQRTVSQSSETTEKTSSKNGATLIVDDQAQKERLKSLSVFGTLVSPKLRTSQLSFETALEKIVEIANARSTMLAAFDRVKKQMGGQSKSL